MKKFTPTRRALAAALVGCTLLNVACGNGTIQGSSAQAVHSPQGSGADSRRGVYDAQAQLLADQLELDLTSQGVSPADARSISLGALEGSRTPTSESDAKALGLIDLKSFLPGFLQGALGVAKTLFAGTPLGVASTIVESVVKGFSKKGDAPKDVLSSLPAIALEALLKKGTGTAGSKTSGAGTQPANIEEMLIALLASGRGITALPQAQGSDTGQADATADVSRQMMQRLVAALLKQPGTDANVLAQLLPQLQDALQRRVVGNDSAQAPAVLGALSEGQFAALLGMKTEPTQRDALLNLLLQKGADTLLTKAGVGNDALRAKLLQAVAQGAAKPVQSLRDVTQGVKQDLLQALTQTLTNSVLKLDDRFAPLKKQALEASLLGLSKGLLATKGVSQQELAEVFGNVSLALSRGALTQPTAGDDVKKMLLQALGQASVAAVDEAKGTAEDLKRGLLEASLRGIASGMQAETPHDELLEALLVVLNQKAQAAKTPSSDISESDLIALLAAK